MAEGPSITRLSHVCLGSTDLARTIAFYRDLFGCAVAHEFRNDVGELYGVFLSCHDGTFLEFFKETTPKGRDSLFRHLCFQVEDIAAMVDRLRGAGLDAVVRRGRTDRVLQCFVEDPDGIGIELQQHDAESVLFRFVYGRTAPAE